MNLTDDDINALEQWWVDKSRVNFFAYRQFMRGSDFLHNWFIHSMAQHLQNFYVDMISGKRPVLFIQSPPQHGKSINIMDFICWISGKIPGLRIIFSSFSERLSVRCNNHVQRTIDSDRYRKIFPGTQLARKKGGVVRTSTHLEFVDENNKVTGGQFRNTTVAGQVTGESMDCGIIDDVIKGREQANSLPLSEKIWSWFLDDFSTRFSENAGLIIIMTRWTTHDIIGRLKTKYTEMGRDFKLINYPAIANSDGKNRKKGDPLFPELKSLDFLKEKKSLMLPPSWDALYQGNPTQEGGNMIKDEWWKWWERLPQIKFHFAVADTAQKKNNWNDYTSLQHWGYGVDGNIYLFDHEYDQVTVPELERRAEIFYLRCQRKKGVGAFRGICIEDKSSGIGLVQKFQEKKYKVNAIPRSIDKITRAGDCGPEIKAGKVYLNAQVPHVDVIAEEGRLFPNGRRDDAFDNVMNAIEVAYIHPHILNNTVYVA